MRTLACVVFVLYLGWTGTAVAEGGAGTGLSRSALLPFAHTITVTIIIITCNALKGRLSLATSRRPTTIIFALQAMLKN